jgi:hypothetical protein
VLCWTVWLLQVTCAIASACKADEIVVALDSNLCVTNIMSIPGSRDCPIQRHFLFSTLHSSHHVGINYQPSLTVLPP